MQIKSLRTIAYRSWVVDDTTPSEAVERLKKVGSSPNVVG